MMVKQLQAALKAGERFFVDESTPEIPLEVLKWGPPEKAAWVRFQSPNMKHWISTNIRTFSLGITGVYKPAGEEEGEQFGGGGANGVLPKGDGEAEECGKRATERVPRNGSENKGIRK